MNRSAPRSLLFAIALQLMIVVLLLVFPVCVRAATGRVECNSVPSKILARNVAYCIVLPPSFEADRTRHFPVLYFLHGLGDNEQFLVHSGAWNLVEDLRERGELKDFLIATPDGGAGFYINSRDGKNRYEDFLLQEFFQFIAECSSRRGRQCSEERLATPLTRRSGINKARLQLHALQTLLA
jgi:S-formylglutathione hydrolase FrmB